MNETVRGLGRLAYDNLAWANGCAQAACGRLAGVPWGQDTFVRGPAGGAGNAARLTALRKLVASLEAERPELVAAARRSQWRKMGAWMATATCLSSMLAAVTILGGGSFTPFAVGTAMVLFVAGVFAAPYAVPALWQAWKADLQRGEAVEANVAACRRYRQEIEELRLAPGVA